MYRDLNHECYEQNLYCTACGSLGGINSVSFFCKSATVLFYLSPNIANYDFLYHSNSVPEKKKCRKCFCNFSGLEVVIF